MAAGPAGAQREPAELRDGRGAGRDAARAPPYANAAPLYDTIGAAAAPIGSDASIGRGYYVGPGGPIGPGSFANRGGAADPSGPGGSGNPGQPPLFFEPGLTPGFGIPGPVVLPGPALLPVSEPRAIALLVAGLAVLLRTRRRRA